MIGKIKHADTTYLFNFSSFLQNKFIFLTFMFTEKKEQKIHWHLADELTPKLYIIIIEREL